MKKIFFVTILFWLNNCFATTDFKSYLQAMKSVAIEFTQVDSKGNEAEGKLLINKPYKFRCNYYPPYPLLIVGNKNYISFFDYDMDDLSRIKSEENIFSFLLTENGKFDKHLSVKSTNQIKNILEVELYNEELDRTSLLVFDTDLGQIIMMKIFEDDNTIIINFTKLEQVKRFDEDLFILKNPDVFGSPQRLEKDDIEKKYQI